MLKISHSVHPPKVNYNVSTPQDESDSDKRERLHKISVLARLCEVKEPEVYHYPDIKRLGWIK